MDGTSSCNGLDGAQYLSAKWNNSPAIAGHLQDPQGGFNLFSADNFMNQATDAVFAGGTTPRTFWYAHGLFQAAPNGGTDKITVDFLPDPANPPAARACTSITVSSPYFAVIGNENGVPMSVSGSKGLNGEYTLQLQTQPGAKDSTGQPMSGSVTMTFYNTPDAGLYTPIGNTAVKSVSGSVVFRGESFSMSCPPFEIRPGQPPKECGFVANLIDMSNPMYPRGEVDTTAYDDLSKVSLNFYFPGPFK